MLYGDKDTFVRVPFKYSYVKPRLHRAIADKSVVFLTKSRDRTDEN